MKDFPDLYKKQVDFDDEIRTRELINHLNTGMIYKILFLLFFFIIISILDNNLQSEFVGIADVIPASVVVQRFLENTTDSLWNNFEQDLLEVISNREQFCKVYEKISPVHTGCINALALHIKKYAAVHQSIDYWCCKLNF